MYSSCYQEAVHNKRFLSTRDWEVDLNLHENNQSTALKEYLYQEHFLCKLKYYIKSLTFIISYHFSGDTVYFAACVKAWRIPWVWNTECSKQSLALTLFRNLFYVKRCCPKLNYLCYKIPLIRICKAQKELLIISLTWSNDNFIYNTNTCTFD